LFRRAELYDIIALQLEIEKGYGITTMQYTFLFLAFYASSILTGMFVGFIADALGRRYVYSWISVLLILNSPVLIFLYAVNLIGFILNLYSAYVASYKMLVISRIVAGYCEYHYKKLGLW
jgi:MFS family permease